MPKEQSIEISILGIKITMVTDQPNEMYALAQALNNELQELTGQYPGAKPTYLLIFGCLKMLQENKTLKEGNDLLKEERERINKALQGFFIDID